MKTVSMNDHDMEKQNLVTTSRGDFYKCKVCGTAGFRTNVSPIILVTEAQFKISQKCTFIKKVAVTTTPGTLPTEVHVLQYLDQFGIEVGVHKVVPCPAEYQDRFGDQVWVWSEKRKEAVRLLEEEYKISH